MLRLARVLLVCGCLICAVGILLVFPPAGAGINIYLGPATQLLLLTPAALLLLYLASWFLRRGWRTAAGMASLAAAFHPGVSALTAGSFTWREARDALFYAQLGNSIRRQAIAGIVLVGVSALLLAWSCVQALRVTWRLRLPGGRDEAGVAHPEEVAHDVR